MSEHRLAIDGVDYAVRVRRNAQARRIVLRMARSGDNSLVLTLPMRQSVGSALRWAAGQGDFVRRSLARQPRSVPFQPDSLFPLEGRQVSIRWDPKAARKPILVGDELIVGGPQEGLARRIERWLKALALEQLSSHSAAFAKEFGLALERVTVGDPKSRWGSCSSSGNIRYSWRLICAPPDVLRAVAAHEVAHIAHPNHGRDFHALVDEILGESAKPAYAWLRSHGASLYGVGRLA